MAEKKELTLDRAQIKKAVQALQAFLKTKTTGESLFLNETQQISLLFTLWKIPKVAQTIRIPLPHGQRPDTEEICLFTRDEPNMTSEQTQRFYKRLLEEKGVKNISEIIPYKVLKTEYKPYEAKRRLLGNFDLFLSDDRIRRLLPTHLGKHFYERKKEPLSLSLQSKNLARDIQSVIQGTAVKVTNKGCCWASARPLKMNKIVDFKDLEGRQKVLEKLGVNPDGPLLILGMARVAHSGMTADEVTENIIAAVQTFMAKLRMNGPVMKLIHLKSQTSVALPIYTSDLSHLGVLQTAEHKGASKKQKKKTKKEDQKQADSTAKTKKKLKKKTEEEEEEIPQLVPIETPSKKPKLEKPAKKKQLQKAAKPAAVKKSTKAQSKVTKKAPKMASKVKRKGAKVK